MVGVQTNVGKKTETTNVYYYNKLERWEEREIVRARGVKYGMKYVLLL